MKWEGGRESDNVEDRRGEGGGGGGGFGFGGRSIGLGTVAIALVASIFFGVDPRVVLGLLGGGGGGPSPQVQQQRQADAPKATDRESRFVGTVLALTEDAWTPLFKEGGGTYKPPRLVLFEGRTDTACGTGNSATGPFYCPPDQTVYIDLSFFRLMQQRFNVAGEFAQAYVIAHEVGHHVQNLLGTSDQVHNAQQNASEKQGNALSVKLELQADCLAGVWAYHANQKQASWKAATSKPRWPRPLPSATTPCSASRRAPWCRTRSPTAARRSGCAGSGAVSTAATSSNAIPSMRASSDACTLPCGTSAFLM